jgi:hypothetical protein
MPADAPWANPHRHGSESSPIGGHRTLCPLRVPNSWPPRRAQFVKADGATPAPSRYPVAYRPKSSMVTEPTLIRPIPTEMLVAPEGIAGVVQLAWVQVELLG